MTSLLLGSAVTWGDRGSQLEPQGAERQGPVQPQTLLKLQTWDLSTKEAPLSPAGRAWPGILVCRGALLPHTVPVPASVSQVPFTPNLSLGPRHPSSLSALSVFPRTTLETLGHEWPCTSSTSISTNTMTRWAAPGPQLGAEEVDVSGHLAL